MIIVYHRFVGLTLAITLTDGLLTLLFFPSGGGGGEIIVLAEEYVYREGKGRISLLKIKEEKKRYVLLSVTPILSKTTHLSFPYIYKEGDNIYLCPENSVSGGVTLYRYSKNEEMEEVGLIIDRPLVDVQIFHYDSFYYAVGCERGDGRNLNTTRILHIYRSETLSGNYQLFQTIENAKKEERGAGRIFLAGDKIIRPAQCCEGGYGIQTIFYELSLDDTGILSEKEIGRLSPQRARHFGLSLHTFDSLDCLCVVDGHDYKNLFRISRMIAPYVNHIYWKYCREVSMWRYKAKYRWMRKQMNMVDPCTLERQKWWIKCGAHITGQIEISSDVYFDAGNAHRIYIDEGTKISSRCLFLCHKPNLEGYHFGSEIGRMPMMVDDIHIGKGVLIGMDTVIMPGVTIGDGAIIGAGSLVTRDIPAWTVAVGRPARVIREIPR